jgi:hypothetical protein
MIKVDILTYLPKKKPKCIDPPGRKKIANEKRIPSQDHKKGDEKS